MAYPSEHFGLRSNGALRVVLVLVVMFLVVYIVGLGLYSNESSYAAQVSCSCDCDCSEEFDTALELDCGKDDPDVSEEMQKDIVALMSDEIKLQKTVANESLQQTWSSVMTAWPIFSKYGDEAQKCSAQTEVCEAGREKAEAGLTQERKITALWEQRARELGWGDSK